MFEAAFSRAVNRHILTSNTPNALHIFDPVSRTDQAIALSCPPVSLSLSLDGLLAVVGHDGGISAINLKLGQIVGFYPVPLDVKGLSLTPRGIVFTSPSLYVSFDRFSFLAYSRGVSVSLDLGTGRTRSLPQPIGSGGPTKLWPDGLTLYANS